MKRRMLQLQLDLDDPFQAKLDAAVRGLGYGQRNRFLVNLSRTLFVRMDVAAIQNAMDEIAYNIPHSIEKLMQLALEKVEVSAIMHKNVQEKSDKTMHDACNSITNSIRDPDFSTLAD